ncbi:hypothetical protein QSV34_05660 [Porticoccus sp. W117]|uniref:hypothetical protein n=1 Tax=Porticoccus sp. W117 TaxID=3054777 RepID=UPI0025913AC8|nr:hypothetical protein [Porticoccus sp. W117]MDM3870837.1 hypothetical protein [Porticoccus sp. W117]
MNKIFIAVLTLWAIPTQADNWNTSVEAGLESRWFIQDARLPNQHSGVGLSLKLQPEFRYKSDDRKTQFALVPFLRYDAEDSERTHFDLREAYWRHIGDEWEVTAGVDKVFWGVAESRHLVDIINQTDLVEDIDQEDKLGQPMVSASTQKDWGAISLYWLPYFRERTFPGADGRLRTPLPVDNDRAQYESAAGQWHQDIALRYSHYFGDWDVGASYFRGTNREARLLPDNSGEWLLPNYDQIDQLGVDLQYTWEAWLLKVEGIYQKSRIDNFFATVAGFEYTFYQVAETSTDIGVLLEYQYDGRNAAAPATLADDDVFAGMRWSLNDTQDTAVLAGVAVDRHSGEQFYNIEAETRIGQNITAELRARFLTGSEPGESAFFVERDDYIQLSLSYHL